MHLVPGPDHPLPVRWRHRLRLTAPLLLVAAAALTATVLVQASSPEPGDASPAYLALAGLDPVLLLAGEEVQGDHAIDLIHGPYRYIFTTEKHRARFKKEPDRYRIQGNGRCPVYPGLAAHPWTFLLHEGRVYAFSGNAAMQRFQEDPSRYIDDQGQPIGFRDARTVAILLYEGVDAVDVAIPGVVFQVAGRDGTFRAFTVGATSGTVRSQDFLDMTPDHTFADSPPADILVVPGGGIDDVVHRPEVIAWVRQAAAEADAVLGLSTGAFILASAGLLDGLEATTHSAAVDEFRHFAQRTLVSTGQPVVDAGKVVTSPGGRVGLDASLHLLARLGGEAAARRVASYMAYPSWQPQPGAASRPLPASSP